MVAWILWIAGNRYRPLTVVLIPFRLFTCSQSDPMVHLAVGSCRLCRPWCRRLLARSCYRRSDSQEWRETMLFACYAMFGMSFFAR